MSSPGSVNDRSGQPDIYPVSDSVAKLKDLSGRHIRQVPMDSDSFQLKVDGIFKRKWLEFVAFLTCTPTPQYIEGKEHLTTLLTTTKSQAIKEIALRKLAKSPDDKAAFVKHFIEVHKNSRDPFMKGFARILEKKLTDTNGETLFQLLKDLRLEKGKADIKFISQKIAAMSNTQSDEKTILLSLTMGEHTFIEGAITDYPDYLFLAEKQPQKAEIIRELLQKEAGLLSIFQSPAMTSFLCQACVHQHCEENFEFFKKYAAYLVNPSKELCNDMTENLIKPENERVAFLANTKQRLNLPGSGFYDRIHKYLENYDENKGKIAEELQAVFKNVSTDTMEPVFTFGQLPTS